MTYTNFWLQYYMRRRQSEGTTVSCSGCAAYDCPPCGTCEQEVGCLPCGTCDYETHPNQNFYHKLTFNTIQIPWTACSAIGGEGSVTGQWINDTGFVCGYFPAKIFTVTSSGGDCAGPDGCDGCSIWEYVQGGPGINNVSRLGMRQHAVWDKTPECADGSCLPLGQQCCSQQSACYCPSAGSSGCCPGEDVIDAGLYTALPSYSGVVNTQLYTRENAVYLKHVGDSCNVCVQPIVCSCEDYPGASSTYADCDGNREACNAPPEGFSFEIECLNAPDADTGCNTGRTIQMGGVGNPIVINLEIPAGSPSLYIAKLTANAIGSWPIECWTPEHGQSNCYGCEEDCTYRFPTDDCFSQAESTEVLFLGKCHLTIRLLLAFTELRNFGKANDQTRQTVKTYLVLIQKSAATLGLQTLIHSKAFLPVCMVGILVGWIQFRTLHQLIGISHVATWGTWDLLCQLQLLTCQ